ncbi:uncharacterized protein LOC128271084 [Anopheles cruzii]|uniref:uncharacterized protein LOC128271084 n=1 Tax=Anopheles cruzii TaxID=68878 RepID=UPI0022EC5268|nr:uncharacterized protein LOC128271084 [Anopheles cruzii]
MYRACFVVSAVLALATFTGAMRHHRYFNQHHHDVPPRGCHRHHHHHHHFRSPPTVPRFEIYKPQGLEVYITDQNQSATFFSIDIFVNGETGSPVVSQNITKPEYGKFIVYDANALLKPGDTVSYVAQLGLTNSQPLQYNHRFIVRDDMVRRNCTCEDLEAPRRRSFHSFLRTTPKRIRLNSRLVPIKKVTRPTTTTTEATANATETTTKRFTGADSIYTDYEYHDEPKFECEIDPSTNLCKSAVSAQTRTLKLGKMVAEPAPARERIVLEGIVTMMQNQCSPWSRSNYLTFTKPTAEDQTVSDWVQYVKTKLSMTPEIKQLVASTVQEAKPDGTSVLFKTTTLLDKLKLLFLCQEAGIKGVQDYDFYPVIQATIDLN